MELFERTQAHLLNDDIPSEYFNTACDEPFFHNPPFNMLKKLKQTKQSLKHHPEGNVWNHTMLVIDEAAQLKNHSKNSIVFMWAALLHDIGKPSVTKNRSGKITAYNHDKAGSVLVKDFLSQLTDDIKFTDDVAALVRWHMQILYVVNDLPFADIDSMRAQADINEVALLGLADRLGRSNADMKAEKENINLFLQKCKCYNK